MAKVHGISPDFGKTLSLPLDGNALLTRRLVRSVPKFGEFLDRQVLADLALVDQDAGQSPNLVANRSDRNRHVCRVQRHVALLNTHSGEGRHRAEVLSKADSCDDPREL